MFGTRGIGTKQLVEPEVGTKQLHSGTRGRDKATEKLQVARYKPGDTKKKENSCIGRRTDIMDRQMDIWIDRWTYGHMARQMDIYGHMARQMDKCGQRQKYRQIKRYSSDLRAETGSKMPKQKERLR